MDKLPVLIVEGITDKIAIEALLEEPVHIICTYGTMGYDQWQQLADDLDDEAVFVLVDADEPGNKLRTQLKQILPSARHLYTKRVYREVADTPQDELARILHKAHFALKDPWAEIVQLPEPIRRRPPKRRK
jgi:toprim domain protein